MGNETIRFKLDTGSDVNCIPVKTFKRLNIELNNKNNFLVSDYNGNRVKVFGTVNLKCMEKNQKMYGVLVLLL